MHCDIEKLLDCTKGNLFLLLYNDKINATRLLLILFFWERSFPFLEKRMLSEDHARPNNSDLNVATLRQRSHPHIGGGNLINACSWRSRDPRNSYKTTLPHFLLIFIPDSNSSFVQSSTPFHVTPKLFARDIQISLFLYITSKKAPRRSIRLKFVKPLMNKVMNFFLK